MSQLTVHCIMGSSNCHESTWKVIYISHWILILFMAICMPGRVRSLSLFQHSPIFHLNLNKMAASLISPWLLWWPPAESYYNIYDHSAVGYFSHAHCIVLLYSVGNKITTTYRQYFWRIFMNEILFCFVFSFRLFSNLFLVGQHQFHKWLGSEYGIYEMTL